MCQAGVFGESPGTIHERDYDDRTGSSLTIVGLAMTIGQKTDSKSMARKMVDPYQYTQDILKQYGPGGTAYEGGRKLPEPGNPKKVFVSHGHDDKAKTDVKSFLETKGLEPIILADQPNAGRTIFEKFEDYGDVGFAIILLTADDMGRANAGTAADLRPRARQNVIMEMVYFMAKLGRGRVCALLQDGVEIPSNISGIVTIRFAADEKWESELTRELVYAGLRLRP